MKFETDLTQQITVDFSAPAKATAFFIDGDWKESFYTFSDLEAVAEHLAFASRASMRGETYSPEGGKFTHIEGFPTFAYKDGKLIADSHEQDCGVITICGNHEPEQIDTCEVAS